MDTAKLPIEMDSEDPQLAKMLQGVVTTIKGYADQQISHIKRLSEIGIALSSEKNLLNLLEMIVDESRNFCNADAGTLYLLNEEGQCLDFAIVQNDTMKTRMGGRSGPITWPSVPLIKDGKPNHSNVSSYVALTGEIVNIPDVYEAEGFDFSGTKKFDAGTGYRSMSMLVVPMRNMDNEVIGVLQLINALNLDSKRPVPFLQKDVELIASLASQAAVAITNVQLYRDLERLFDSFIQAIASAIDEKSPYTAGHIQRVQRLTMDIARAVNEVQEGPLKDVYFNEDQMKELAIAAWLHDVGKITTPEHVVDKSTKLEAIFDREHLIRCRFENIKKAIIIRHLQTRLESSRDCATEGIETAIPEEVFKREIEEIEEEVAFVAACNQPGEFMDDSKIERLRQIAQKRWKDNGSEVPYLTENELYNLSIRKGSLNNEDRKIIENHATVTYKMLSKLPFPKKLKNVPEIAAKHHEKLDGTGYPFGSKADEIPYQARILAIADVFEALTAKDRPYKKAMPLSQALKIMGFMRKDRHIDGDILDLFIQKKLYLEYAKRELNPEQIDCD